MSFECSGIAWINYNFLLRPHLKNQENFSYFHYQNHIMVIKPNLYSDLNKDAKEYKSSFFTFSEQENYESIE